MKRLLSTSLLLALMASPAFAEPVTQEDEDEIISLEQQQSQDVSIALEESEPVADLRDDDDVVRLPGSGEVKSDGDRAKLKARKLKPGGGLLASFDADGNGWISDAEIEIGIEAAFEAADANEDGYLTALEQQAWAEGLPTRDDSLANPVRFDPNLDRRVSFTEFRAVIFDLSKDYRDEDHTELRVASLKAPEEKKRNPINIFEGELGTRVGSTDF